MEELTNPSGGDLIREALIVIIGMVVRYFERRRLLKNATNGEPQN